MGQTTIDPVKLGGWQPGQPRDDADLSQEERAAVRETLGKCVNPATGEPVSARKDEFAVPPVKGSISGSADGNGKGTCPHCGTSVPLSTKGYITSHSVRNTPIPVPKVRLKETAAPVADAGARIGDPTTGEVRRNAELTAAAGTATVMIQMKNPDTGKRETVKVAATEANIRTALRQQYAKKQRPERTKSPAPGVKGTLTGRMLGGPDMDLCRKLSAMLRGVTGTQAVPVSGAEPGTYKVREAVTLDATHFADAGVNGGRGLESEGRGTVALASPGPALVKGPNMTPVEPKREGKNGKPRNGTMAGPLGRPRPDRGAVEGAAAVTKHDPKKAPLCAAEECEHIAGGTAGYLTYSQLSALSRTPTGRTQRRRYWKHVETNRARAQRAKEYASAPRAVRAKDYASCERATRADAYVQGELSTARKAATRR